ncbi:hypothetical protein MA16_Dca020170 [Dendrobium catenatum]|uniref:Uncharacterized protein n=1 Tax=Dendrobium catenatum TaxID=906689 RepID=A0A2I0VU97_9ASPA|nr:hypothetical protein MA16_Dca020170 [Dendrobium catenatum]
MRRQRGFNKISETIQTTAMGSKQKSIGITSLTNMRERSIHKNQQLLDLPNNIKNIQATTTILQNLKRGEVKI